MHRPDLGRGSTCTVSASAVIFENITIPWDVLFWVRLGRVASSIGEAAKIASVFAAKNHEFVDVALVFRVARV